MSDEQTSSLTVAKLKALCILNDLSTSGKKSDLLERLLDAGLSNKEVGLPSKAKAQPVSKPKEEKVLEVEPVDEIVLSMEDEDTITPAKKHDVTDVEDSSEEGEGVSSLNTPPTT